MKLGIQKKKYSRRKVIMITLGGSILEYYNYSLYGLAAALIFNHQFFPNVTPALAIVLSLATFGSGFLAQPLGSILFSHIGDKHGRARSLFITMILLGGVTVGIGLVPNYSTIGIWAPISLLFLRVVQGIAAGGEMSGSAIFGLESAPDNKRALYGSFTSMGSGIGALIGVIIFFTISEVFGERAFQEWAWRIPFLFGAVILVFVFLARRGVVEQEKIEFEKKDQQSEIASFPLGEVFRNYKLTFLKVVGVEIGYMAFAMLGAIYFLTYLKSVGFSDHVTMVAQILYQVVIVPLVPVMAMISDNWNRKALMCIGSILNIFTMTAFFMIVPGSSPIVVYILTISVAVTTTVMYGGMLTFLAEQFPARIRYTGFGVAFAVGGAIGGGFGPTVAAIIFGASNGSGIMLSLFAAGLGLLMVISTLGLKNHSQCMLEEIDTDLVQTTEAIQKYVESGR
ncbi:MFS transporter [Peribacillus simplex]|uniref:MFS transporter n=1 Tax=Peribacillus simplex TaxID=1478 RepID=UPI003671E7C8